MPPPGPIAPAKPALDRSIYERQRMKVRVLVRLKPGILDVQGSAVKRALGGLGFNDVVELRIGKVIEVDVEAASAADARARVDDMCRKLLANPILEDYSIE
jgi:phosphoribosylformylglycinamidine synthase